MTRSSWLVAACAVSALGVASAVSVAASPATARQLAAVTTVARPAAAPGLPAAPLVAPGLVLAERERDRDRDRDRRCQYPPSRTPSISLSGPERARRGERVTLSGSVTLNRCPLARATVALYTSDDGVSWTPTSAHPVRTTLTAADGSYSFVVTDPATHYYRALVLAGPTYDAALSNVVRVVRR